MAEEQRGINVLFGQLFQSSEKGENEIRNSSTDVQREKESQIQGLCTEKDAFRSQKNPEA